MYLGADGNIDMRADRRRLSRARRARHRARSGRRTQEVRQASVERRRHAGRRACRGGIRAVGGAGAQPQRAKSQAAWQPFRPRSRPTASPAAATGRRAIGWSSTDLGKTLRAIADRRPGRVLQGLDRRSHRRGHEGQRRPHHQGGSRGLSRRRNARRCAARIRGFDIISMPPPSSGGVALIEMLNILEPLRPQGRRACSTAPALHLEIEAMRRAYLDRARFLGDPDFVQVPVARLTSKEPREAGWPPRSIPRRRIEQRRARQGHRHAPPRRSPTRPRTSRCSIADGMAVANTYTLEGGFGSHVVVKGAGFLLNNEMGDFNKKPGATNRDRRHRHAGQPHRAGQADAQLDDADDRHEGRQAGARHRLARRPHDHQHRASTSCSASPSTA